MDGMEHWSWKWAFLCRILPSAILSVIHHSLRNVLADPSIPMLSYIMQLFPSSASIAATCICHTDVWFSLFLSSPPLLASRAAVWHSQCTGVAVHWLCTHIEISYTHRSKWHAAHTASWCCLCYTVWCCLCLQGVCRNERMYVSEWLSGRACRCLVRAWVKRRYYAVPITVIDTLHLP